METYHKFEEKTRAITNIGNVLEQLRWDQEVVMPEEGINARASQISILSGVLHDKVKEEELGELISELERKDLSREKEAVLREVRREHKRAEKIPEKLEKKIAEKESETVDTWKKAKKESDFGIVEEDLRELVELKREYAENIDPDSEPYKVLFQDYEPYIEFETMQRVLENLKEFLTDFIDEIWSSDTEIETEAFRGEFDEEKQEEFAQELAEKIGYDYSRGRLDVSEHPFTLGTTFDARITTRFSEDNLAEGLLPTIHEAGHAIYEQGLPDEHYGTPLGDSRDLTIHESQSRLWENHVGRSLPFQRFLLPLLKDSFDSFEDVSARDLYESINQVFEDNMIRVNSDELTYHLHIILRYELERDLINGDIEVEKLPELWNQKMEEYLGLTPENDTEGVLQDIHWYQGTLGYFPTYSLGTVLSAQLYRSAEQDLDNLEQKIEDGEFSSLREWLRDEIHSKGCLLTTDNLIESVTGENLKVDYFRDYAEQKYSEIYGL